MRRPHWRKMTWLILVFNGLMLWLLVSTASIPDYGPRESLRGAVTFFWVAGDLVLGILWLLLGRRRRGGTAGLS